MKANQIDLKSVKLSGLGIEACYMFDSKEFKAKGKDTIHPDLAKAIKALVPYLVEVCEMQEADDIDWKNLDGSKTSEACIKYGVSGISLSGSESTLSLTISGHKLLKTNKTLVLQTPRIMLSDDADDGYERKGELIDLVQTICFEAEAYIIDRKFGYQQGSLDFKDDDEDGTKVFDPYA